MDLSDYQRRAHETAVYPGADPANQSCPALAYLGLKLAGEAGEVSEKIGKLFRDRAGQASPEWREDVAKELGDVLWYLSEIAFHLCTPLAAIAEQNLAKLADRAKRGVLKGGGDNR